MLGLGLGVDVSSYIPMDLKSATTDLELWLKNGVGVATDQWDDSSGNDNHAFQDTEGARAAVSDGGLDFEADSSTHYDLTNTITIANEGGFCMAAVIELETVSGVTLLGKDALDQFAITTDTTFVFRSDTPGTITTNFRFASNTFDTNKMLILLNRNAGATNKFTFQKNSTTLTADVDTSTNEADGENPGGFDIKVLGARQGASQFFDGKILELAFWSKGLSATEIADVNSYLTGIHGL
jgi:hypothetical protein